MGSTLAYHAAQHEGLNTRDAKRIGLLAARLKHSGKSSAMSISLALTYAITHF